MATKKEKIIMWSGTALFALTAASTFVVPGQTQTFLTGLFWGATGAILACVWFLEKYFDIKRKNLFTWTCTEEGCVFSISTNAPEWADMVILDHKANFHAG
jgi:hypothetical protein